MRRSLTFLFIKQGRELFSLKSNLAIQGNILRAKKKTKFCNKLSMKVNLLVEFNREKCNLSYKAQIYKIKKTTTLTFTNTHLEVFIWFWIINWYIHKCHVPDKCKKKRLLFVTTKLMNNLAKFVISKWRFPH